MERIGLTMMRRLFASTSLTMFAMLGLLWMLDTQRTDSFSTYYVAPDCNGVPVPCFTTIQAAINAVDNSQDVVKVATGIYTDIHQVGGLQQIVYLSKTLVLRGGYRVDDWETAYPITQPTMLDAQRFGRVIYTIGSISPTIEGLWLKNGDSYLYDDDPQSNCCGGGLSVITASAIISGCVIEQSYGIWGGGVYLMASPTTLINTAVTSNGAYMSGGGVYVVSSPAALISNTIHANAIQNGNGGGVAIEQSSGILVAGNSISFNWAHPSDMYAQPNGGGVYLVNSQGTIYHNIIRGNYRNYDVVYHGGGIFAYGSDLVISANTIISNFASWSGGGLCFQGGSATFDNNFFADNVSGGVYVDQSNVLFRHNTIARNNIVGSGEGILLGPNTSAVLTDTILVSQTIGIYVGSGAQANLNATVWGAGAWQNQTDWLVDSNGLLFTGTLNLWGDPAFVNPALGDYHIGAGSIAHNNGVFVGVTTDVDGDYRLDNCRVDIGADEFIGGDGCAHKSYLPIIWHWMRLTQWFDRR